MSYRLSTLAVPARSGSVCGTTISSDEPLSHVDAASVPRTLTGKKSRFFNQIKDWLSTSEPSLQAMKTQKKMTYQRHGIDMKDPRAAAKLHLPTAKIPEGAITSTSGPSPEKALKKAQQQQARKSISATSQSSHSKSSSIFSLPSTKEVNHVAPWEN